MDVSDSRSESGLAAFPNLSPRNNCVSRREIKSAWMRIRFCTMLLTASACTHPTAVPPALVGIYSLESVDGVAIPTSLTLSSGCSGVVTGGYMNLLQAGVETLPLYGLAVDATESCPDGSVKSLQPLFSAGTWSVKGDKLITKARTGSSVRAEQVPSVSPPSVDVSFGGSMFRFHWVSLTPE